MTTYQFISEIYRLLGELDDRMLGALRQIPLAPDVRPIIDAFAAAKQKQEVNVVPDAHPTRNVIEADKSSSNDVQQTLSPGIGNATIGDLLKKIHQKFRNAEFVEIATAAGIPITPRNKESRSDLMTRVLRAANAMPADRRERIFRNLLKVVQASETQGWMEVIRSTAKS